MRRFPTLVLLAVAIAVAASCAKEPPPQPAQKGKRPGKTRSLAEKGPDDSADRVSIINIARGTTVVSRTGEAILETSAIRAIDGDPISYWMSPPRDLPQSMIVRLAAKSRITRVGFRTDEALPVSHVQFDRSTDGVTFVPMMTAKCAETADAQWFDVTPAEATHLRVTMVDSPVRLQDTRLGSILARGNELEPPRAGLIAGCWSVNGRALRLEHKDGRVTGAMTVGRLPIQIDGGFDGRVYRLSWIRGNDYGYTLATVAPEGGHLSAMEWHEEAIPLFFGDSWFGEHAACGGVVPFDAETPVKLLRRTGRYSLFGLRFRDDGSLDREASAATLQWLVSYLQSAGVSRFVAHEFRRGNAAANRAFAQRELDSLRAELQRAGAKFDAVAGFVAQGSDAPRQEPSNEPMRVIYSTIDLEIRR